MALVVRVLGAAAGGGFPQWNAGSAACRRARAGEPAAKPATQASIAVSSDRRRFMVVNASPDLRQQIEATPALHPEAGGRNSPIAAVALTNADVDAVAGLLSLREGTPFSLYAHNRVHARLDENPIFDVVNPAICPRRPLAEDHWQPIEDADGAPLGLEVRPFRAPGKAPLYAEGDTARLDTAATEGDTLGLEIRAGESRLVYLANCAAVTAEVADRLRGQPLVLFDGTLFSDDEMIVQRAGAKTGRRMGHISIGGPDGALAALSPLGIGRLVFIHLNNTNPALLADSPERALILRAGAEVAFDGMEIVL